MGRVKRDARRRESGAASLEYALLAGLVGLVLAPVAEAMAARLTTSADLIADTLDPPVLDIDEERECRSLACQGAAPAG